MVVGPGRKAAVVGVYQVLSRVSAGPRRLRLRGLDPAAQYRISMWPESVAPAPAAARIGGDALMAAGLVIEAHRENALVGDFHARLYVLEADDSVAQAAGT
ncbi:MAG: GH36 C-terminal domain-containing protein [Candidatus Limnocylindrales bacterium]